MYKGAQNSSRTSTVYSFQGPCSCCIPFKSISVGRRSLVSTLKPITSLILTIVPDRAIKEKSQKGLKDDRGWETPVFFEKQQPTCFLNPIFWRGSFFSFKKTQNPYSDLFLLHHAISPFSEWHNNNLLYLLLWYSNLRVQKCNVPHLCFRKVLRVNSLQSGKT